MTSKEVIKRMIDEFQGEDLAEYLSSELEEIRKVRVGRTDIERRLKELAEAYKIKCDLMKEQLAQLRLRCKHWDFSFHGDPSGGNDSFHRCEVCGKEW